MKSTKSRIVAMSLTFVFVALSFGVTGCATVTRTQFENVAVGGPVWMKRTIRTDHVTAFGSKMVDLEVGFVYCENVPGQGPVCLPVDVKNIPRALTHQSIVIQDGLIDPASKP
jgi:hypothetical protein